ncbi:MAG TPA: hypothetical protein VJS92_16275, partial [Candidatus Polarisedimenticolaceae bacterium]|nr:hypothetical protein [Candidatus Polarisedimenticolaceae bacterium]
MNPQDADRDEMLDRVLAELRDARLEPQVEAAAAGRVWERLRGELETVQATQADTRTLRDCSDFRALLPAYLERQLPQARAML